MTLEEAKKEINKLYDELRWSKDHDAGVRMNALGDALEILDKVEPVGNSEQLTLRELAIELKKIFRFKYLTAHRSGVELFLRMYAKKPSYFKTYSVWSNADAVFFPIAVSEDLRVDIDLSEYKDADGNIDYSKCIVEVE